MGKDSDKQKIYQSSRLSDKNASRKQKEYFFTDIFQLYTQVYVHIVVNKGRRLPGEY